VAEAPEHQFLSHKFLEVLAEFSQLKLYGYTEADRKKFDFACVLHRDWDRSLVGQTLWKHTEGIDKDIRTCQEPRSKCYSNSRENLESRRKRSSLATR
jgi:hypothetical protein